VNSYRTRFSPLGGAVSAGMPPNELWGVSERDRRVPRQRGSAARARRRAKALARSRGVTLKAYLRSCTPPSKSH
jgi:hypothetical protein